MHSFSFLSIHASADATKDGALDRFKTKIVLSSNGRNMWLGPVLYTFSCKINVNFFPFDEQVSAFEINNETSSGQVSLYFKQGGN